MEKEEPRCADLEQELESLYRKVASTDPPGDSPYPAEQLKAVTAAPEEPGLTELTKDPPLPGKDGPTHRPFLMATGAFFFLSLLCLVAIFFWPTIYYYESLNLGEKIYPIRINKLTGETLYFNGTAWLSPPVATAIKKPVNGNLNNPAPSTPPETNVSKSREGESTAAPTPLMTRDKGEYVIQVKSFPENRKKDAQAFMEDIRKRVPDIQMKTVHIAGHGIWYRIWVGNFSSAKEAANNMKILKLSETYPDSFVRRQSGE